MKCDQCQLSSLGYMGKVYVVHESGCPNQNKTWDKERQEWVQYRDCHDCGFPVEDGEVCNCNLDSIGEDDDN